MSNLTLEFQTGSDVKGDKRQHFPYIAKSKCPKCKNIVSVDFRERYLTYPTFGKEQWTDFYCHNCDHDWEEGVISKLTLEVIK
jgi:hypothetical protein